MPKTPKKGENIMYVHFIKGKQCNLILTLTCELTTQCLTIPVKDKKEAKELCRINGYIRWNF